MLNILIVKRGHPQFKFKLSLKDISHAGTTGTVTPPTLCFKPLQDLLQHPLLLVACRFVLIITLTLLYFPNSGLARPLPFIVVTQVHLHNFVHQSTLSQQQCFHSFNNSKWSMFSFESLINLLTAFLSNFFNHSIINFKHLNFHFRLFKFVFNQTFFLQSLHY